MKINFDRNHEPHLIQKSGCACLRSTRIEPRAWAASMHTSTPSSFKSLVNFSHGTTTPGWLLIASTRAILTLPFPSFFASFNVFLVASRTSFAEHG